VVQQEDCYIEHRKMKIELRNQFKQRAISKPDFIDRMYLQHQELFEYSSLLGETALSGIEITDKGVVFTTREDGIRFFCEKADKRTAPFEILNFNEYESDDAGLFYLLAAGSGTIFDIGANIGWYSLSLARKFPASRVYSFEPLPATFASLERNVRLNEARNIELHNFGFSRENTTLRFFSSRHTSVSNSAENISGESDAVETLCEVRRLDDYMEGKEQTIDLVKCDVEGAELLVFEGAMLTFRRQLPMIFCEMLRKWAAKYNYHPNDIIALLAGLGYHCFVNNGQNRLSAIRQVTDDTIQTNFFFLHPEKHSPILLAYGE
jgi:FkbM family methyltransferase